VSKKAAVSEAPAGPTRVGLISLGCPKNLIDSEVMLGKVAGADADGAGVAIVGDANHADIMVVNTCAFVEAAKPRRCGRAAGDAADDQHARVGTLRGFGGP